MQSAATSRSAKLHQTSNTAASRRWRLKPVASGVLAVVLSAALLPGPAWAQPAGGRVVGGTASINQAGVNTNINQATQNAIIQWNSFNVPGGAAVRFAVPNGGATLNRVNSGNPSAIHGTISSNGAVFLFNPNGVLVGPTGMIDTARFVASTRDIDNAAFMAGEAIAFRGSGDGTVINLGTIKASSGDVLLFGSRVDNAGSISAPQGQVTLAAGDRLLLAPTPMSRIAVEGVSVAGGVSNSGVIDAAQARVLAAGGVYAMAINQTGSIKAGSTLNSAGSIVIDGSDVRISGSLQATSGTDSGALVQITGDTIALTGANIRAVNANDGGTILVGGGWQGKDPDVRNAKVVAVDSNTVLNASAADGTNVVENMGSGGTVVTWADQRTQFAGKNFARGGAAGGNGGRVEVSGKQFLDYAGKTNTLAPNGLAGDLLLDPEDICITSLAACAGGATWSRVTTADIVLDLATTNVNISTAAGLTGNGDIAVESAINTTGTGRLTLDAIRDIKVAQALITRGRIQLTAGRDVLVENFLEGANAAGGVAVGILGRRDVNIGVLGDPTSVTSFTGNVDITANRNIRLGTGAAAGVGNSFAQVQAQNVAKLTAAGSITLDSLPDVNKPVIQAGASGTAIEVKAAKFTNNTGTSAFRLTNPAGRWLVGTVNPANDNQGGLVSDFIQFNSVLGVTPPAQGTGNGFLYSYNPFFFDTSSLFVLPIITIAEVTPQNIAQQTTVLVKPPPPPPPPPVIKWTQVKFFTMAEALAYQATPEFLKQVNPNNLPTCTDPVLVTCFRITPPILRESYSFTSSNHYSYYAMDQLGTEKVSASAEWVNMPAIARETVRPANAVQTGPAVTTPNTPNTGYLARELIAPDVRPTTYTGLPVELAAVEQRLMVSWAVKNLTATELTQFKPSLTLGVDYTLTNDRPPKLLAMLDTPKMKEALASQFRSKDEIQDANGSYKSSRDGSALDSKAEANQNRGDLAMSLFTEAAAAFQVKPENRSKEQQELVTYMYSYIAKEAKETYIQSKAEYTAWTLDTPQGDSNARGDGMMMMFGNVGGQNKSPPLHLMQQSIAGMNMTAAESVNFQNALAGSLSAGVSLAAGAAAAGAVGTAMTTQSAVLAIAPYAAMRWGVLEGGKTGFDIATKFVGLSGGATGGALSVAGIGVALVVTAITGVVTDAVNKADGEKMVQYFRKPGPDMSWMNALTSGNLVEQQSAMARMLAYTTKMVSAY